MKRRAQAGVASNGATAAKEQSNKKRKTAKDEDLASQSSVHVTAPLPLDRPSKARASPSSHAPLVVDDHSSSSSSTISHNSADNSNRSEPEDSSPTTNTRFTQPPHSSNPSSSSSTAQRATATPSTHASSATDGPKLLAAAPKLNSPAPALDPVSSIPDFGICWALINRGPWWPGKILTGEDIPEEVRKKRRSFEFRCVRLYGQDICTWVNPKKIRSFVMFPEGPEVRKRAPQEAELQAIELANKEFTALSSRHAPPTPATSSTRAKRTATAISATVGPSAAPSAPQVAKQQVTKVENVANGAPKTQTTAAHHKSVAIPDTRIPSKPWITAENAAYIQAYTHTGQSRMVAAANSAPGSRVTVCKELVPGARLPESLALYVTAAVPTTHFALAKPVYARSSAVTVTASPKTAGTVAGAAAQRNLVLVQPQAVHRVAPAAILVTNGANTVHMDVTPTLPLASRPASAKQPHTTAKRTAKAAKDTASSTPTLLAGGHTKGTSSPSSVVSVNAMDLSEPTSTTSSRAPSPVRTGQATKINDPFKIVEEFSAYKGVASVGHVTHHKANPLSWNGSRAGSQVDALTVVCSLKQRTPDGQSLSTPITEKHFIGMQNLGNTCYINSAIQCLACVSSFSTPLTSMTVSYNDLWGNNASSSSSSTTSVDESASRGPRGRGKAVAAPAPVVAPIKKTRSRKSLCKPSEKAHHNAEDAKTNPLIVSLVGILKTLSHPEHLITHSDKNPNHIYNGNLLGSAKARRSLALMAKSGALGSSANGISHMHGIQQQLTANSSDEEMDVDPIGEDEDVEVLGGGGGGSSSMEDSESSSSSSTSNGTIAAKEVTKVLHAFQDSSGQLLDEKYHTDQHQDISEFMLHLLEYAHDQLNTKRPFGFNNQPSASATTPVTPTKAQSSVASAAATTSLSSSAQSASAGQNSSGNPAKRAGKASAAAAASSASSSQAPIESPRSIAHAAEYATLPRLEMDCKDWYVYMASNQSPVTNSFDGLLRRTRKCPKDHTFTSYEIFRILTLHFEDENAKECTLESMFSTLRKPEILDCRCSACGGNDDKTFSQVTDVYILPKYLIITLGRFKGSASDQSWWAHKIKTRVKFPLDNLNMAPLFDIAAGQPTPIYNLVAISNHKGSSIHGGHYFSYVRSWSNSEHWVCLNDTTVKEVRTDAIVSNQAYMLFYERQDS